MSNMEFPNTRAFFDKHVPPSTPDPFRELVTKLRREGRAESFFDSGRLAGLEEAADELEKLLTEV